MPWRTVHKFKYLGSFIEQKVGCSYEITERLGELRSTFRSLATVWKNHVLNKAINLKTVATGRPVLFLFLNVDEKENDYVYARYRQKKENPIKTGLPVVALPKDAKDNSTASSIIWLRALDIELWIPTGYKPLRCHVTGECSKVAGQRITLTILFKEKWELNGKSSKL